MTYPYSRQHEAAERVAMRHWLAKRGIKPVVGQEPSHTQKLMIQVFRAGGDPDVLMAEGRAKVDKRRREELETL